MRSHIVIYSADRIRGGILNKILKMSGIAPILFNKIVDIKKEIAKDQTGIVILDISNSLKAEIDFLKELVRNVSNIDILIIGRTSDINQFNPDEIILNIQNILKIKDMTPLKVEQSDTNEDIVEVDLKGFLKLK